MFMHLFMHNISDLKISLQNYVGKGMKLAILKLYETRCNYKLRANNIDDLPLLLARSSKALTFARLAISPRGLYHNNDCSTRLLRTYHVCNFYALLSVISL